MAAALDTLLTGQLLFAALVTGSLYALIALGLNLVYGTMRLLNVAHGELVMLGAYVAFWGFALLGLTPLLALPVAAVVCAVFGVALYDGLLRRMLDRMPLARLEANSLLVFFGLSVIVQNVAALVFTATPRGYAAFSSVIRIGGLAMTESRLLTLGVALTLCLAALAFLRFSVFGLAVKALIQQREAAAIVGIDVARLQRWATAAGFAAAGLAGCLVSMSEQISPFMGFPFTIAAFVVVILGGLGNLTGGILAGFLLGLIETYGAALTSASWRSILVYGAFVAVLLLRPQGLLGARRRYT